MSVLVEQSTGEATEERKATMYPLFQKGTKPKPPPVDQNSWESGNPVDDHFDTAPKKKARGRPRKSTALPAPGPLDPEVQIGTLPTTSNVYGHAELLEVDPNTRRMKRRKTASPDGDPLSGRSETPDSNSVNGHNPIKSHQNKSIQEVPVFAHDATTVVSRTAEGAGIARRSGELLTADLATEMTCIGGEESLPTQGIPAAKNATQPDVSTGPRAESMHSHKPKKILRLNPTTGTIGSPPPPKPLPTAELSVLKPAKRGKKHRSLVVTIRYGNGKASLSSTGARIDQILGSQSCGPKPKEASPVLSEPTKARAPKPTKTIHPLFLGKAAPRGSTPAKGPSSVTDITDLTRHKAPVTQTGAQHSFREGVLSSKRPALPLSGFGTSTKTVKFPGAVEPAWPWQGMVHIRGLDEPTRTPNVKCIGLPFCSQDRKSKYHSVGISTTENIIENLASELSIQNVVKSIQDINLDDYPSAPQCLRVPTKRYESGFAIQRRVRKELQSRPEPIKAEAESSSEDEIQLHNQSPAKIHPAVAKLYDSVASCSSAFDRGRCETQSWTHKYSPRCAADVLQPGREALILKEWVEALTLQSVEPGSGGIGQPTSKPDNLGKRKRRSKKLDGFVVSTDDEENDMDEITEPEDDLPRGSLGQPKRTVIKSKDAALLLKGSKVSNAVVISGPHGCGKTAAIYAVARELGFEVFEINSSSRRNGKDILDKVGDMTRNHQVQRTTAVPQLDGIDDDAKRIDSALADDLKSGRQGTMNSFFKPNADTTTKAKPKAKEEVPTKLDTEQSKSSSTVQGILSEVTKNNIFSQMTTKKQKQSLILIEEVDVLYKEDNQFWATILSLIATSKRPIIMTCTDESVLPMQSLSLYAIIRMVIPPPDLAVDYMLLVAACEGHIIKREAVKGLYEARGLDLRATMTELDFWCQFAIGDVKGGLEWYYPRAPASKHVDEHESTIRVVSDGTYRTGMGWLSQDFLESHIHYLDIEEETLHEACDEWHLDLGDWEKNIGLKVWAQKLQDFSTGKKDDLAALDMYADFADSMSVADLCSGGTFAPEYQVLLDVSCPDLSLKARDDYTLDYELKEAPTRVDYNTLSKSISLYMKSRTRKILHIDQHISHNLDVPTELDRPSEADVLRLIRNSIVSPTEFLTRYDFSLAFDPISANEKYVWATSLEASTFDRTMTLIVEDLAPYVRSIVAYDARLQEDRLKMSDLLSEGGTRGKRMRTTRSAMSALEGGARHSTRRERYFTAALNSALVLRTGMPGWIQASLAETGSRGILATSRRSSKSGLNEEEIRSEDERDELMDASP